ncbi:MAG: flagellar protein FliJ, partial [Micromonosporaceae bacterium]
MSRFRLGAVLRARLAQEDAAKSEVARARQDAAQAAEFARHQGRRLRARGVPVDGSARAIAAALAARHSLAIALAEADQLADEARDRTADQIAVLAEAAKARRSVERLAERYTAAGQLRE